MAKPSLSSKRLQISRANSTVVIAAGAAAFIVIFSAIATKTLVSQAAYQGRVITAKRAAVKQLEADLNATKSLSDSYNVFNKKATNILGGSSAGTGPLDGVNSKIVLDALPSSYDFPALANSVEKLVVAQNLQIDNITGTDDQVNQAQNQSSSTPTPQPIPFAVTVTGPYTNVQAMIGSFEHSIRPIQVQSLTFTASESGNIVMLINAQTFYQPAKSLNISTKVIK
ncbi:MAG: hypothetical protein JWM37_133 [Candidatus Saccharibacteria bacterium]|nr:hypothetical protein [Candidatus Saccharibacteria bacterium]